MNPDLLYSSVTYFEDLHNFAVLQPMPHAPLGAIRANDDDDDIQSLIIPRYMYNVLVFVEGVGKPLLKRQFTFISKCTT